MRATELNLAGWARNLGDGRVEVVARGEDPELSALERDLQQGPSHANVAAVEKSEIQDDVIDSSSFSIR